jgi:hypothetical protein
MNTAGEAHENGDVEQGHHRLKVAIDQALRVRGSRDFVDRAAYEAFVQTLIRRRNQTRTVRFADERQALRPLPVAPLAPCSEQRLTVSKFSTIAVYGNTYSVPSRLIGTIVTVRAHAETLDLSVGTTLSCTLPRLVGRQQHAINDRHIAASLVRKPGAFAAYRYHDDLFPTLAFRRAYDALGIATPRHADREYVRILHLAAMGSESDVDAALVLLADADTTPLFDTVRDLVRWPQMQTRPIVAMPHLDLTVYDRLLPSRCAHA